MLKQNQADLPGRLTVSLCQLKIEILPGVLQVNGFIPPPWLISRLRQPGLVHR